LLDAQEYLHLAIQSSQEGLHQQAIEQLYHCLEINPDDAPALFLLAAEHAEIGMFERAIEGMEKALSLDPSINMASIQLGLLYTQNGDNEKALSTWDNLIENPNEPYFSLFSAGLISLVNKDISEGIELLNKGLEANQLNQPLNDSVLNILSNFKNPAIMDDIDSEANIYEEQSTPEEDNNSIFLGAYKNNTLGS
jgi:tetratricopeptide (TPR) repeat protein